MNDWSWNKITKDSSCHPDDLYLYVILCCSDSTNKICILLSLYNLIKESAAWTTGWSGTLRWHAVSRHGCTGSGYVRFGMHFVHDKPVKFGSPSIQHEWVFKNMCWSNTIPVKHLLNCQTYPHISYPAFFSMRTIVVFFFNYVMHHQHPPWKSPSACLCVLFTSTKNWCCGNPADKSLHWGSDAIVPIMAFQSFLRLALDIQKSKRGYCKYNCRFHLISRFYTSFVFFFSLSLSRSF